MKIHFIRNFEKKLKGRINRFRIHQYDFSIISNNCWGTFIYKKFNLPYHSPFVNMFIFSEDYLRLLENFSPEILQTIRFIPHEASRHIPELKERNHYQLGYPIGVIGEDIELHFLHYKDEADARKKWEERVKRINYDKLLFKFSDSEGASDEMIRRFDALPLKNKLCFTAKPFPECRSVIYLSAFKHAKRVRDEWKHSEKAYDLMGLINEL
ncbi:MAG: DUF1919 domain-containing protein [Sulfuricurvum sp.]|nr:DUF1919 domain-containing protein [Sulfuricurvum sp.]